MEHVLSFVHFSGPKVQDLEGQNLIGSRKPSVYTITQLWHFFFLNSQQENIYIFCFEVLFEAVNGE